MKILLKYKLGSCKCLREDKDQEENIVEGGMLGYVEINKTNKFFL